MSTSTQHDSSPSLMKVGFPRGKLPLPEARLAALRDRAYNRDDMLSRLALMDDRQARLYTIACVERVLPILNRVRPDRGYPAEALEVARRFVNGSATGNDLLQAEDAAWEAFSGIHDEPAAEVALACAWTASWLPPKETERRSDIRDLRVLEAITPCLVAIAMTQGAEAFEQEMAWQKHFAIEVLRGALR